MRCAIGLHLGDAMYGNVGTPPRLDVTVIGTAANVASRLSEACRNADAAVLISQDIARYASAGLRSVGPMRLRDVREELEVFTLGPPP